MDAAAAAAAAAAAPIWRVFVEAERSGDAFEAETLELRKIQGGAALAASHFASSHALTCERGAIRAFCKALTPPLHAPQRDARGDGDESAAAWVDTAVPTAVADLHGLVHSKYFLMFVKLSCGIYPTH